MTKKHSSHILNASSNLLGFCFVVLTSIKILNLAQSTVVDTFTAVSLLLFMVSTLFSFLALRSVSKRSAMYEHIADYVFLVGLLSLFVTTVLITLNLII